MGISVDTLQRYKILSEMISEFEELLDTGVVTKRSVCIFRCDRTTCPELEGRLSDKMER